LIVLIVLAVAVVRLAARRGSFAQQS